jgi:hypothetical protein
MLEQRKAQFEELEAAEQRLSEAEAARIAKAEKKKADAKASGKMKARVEDDRTVVSDYDSETDSESDDESHEEALEAVRLAEEAWRVAEKKNKKKVKSNGTSAVPSVESSFANMNMGDTPTPSHSMPPMFPPSPFHPYHAYPPYGSPYGAPYRSPHPPAMAMYGYYGQPSPFSMVSPGSTINNVNSGNISNFTVSGSNNDNSTRIIRPKRKKV